MMLKILSERFPDYRNSSLIEQHKARSFKFKRGESAIMSHLGIHPHIKRPIIEYTKSSGSIVYLKVTAVSEKLNCLKIKIKRKF